MKGKLSKRKVLTSKKCLISCFLWIRKMTKDMLLQLCFVTIRLIFLCIIVAKRRKGQEL